MPRPAGIIGIKGIASGGTTLFVVVSVKMYGRQETRVRCAVFGRLLHTGSYRYEGGDIQNLRVRRMSVWVVDRKRTVSACVDILPSRSG